MERLKKLLKSDKNLTWLFYGDSITHGASYTFGSRDYTELFTERVRYEMGRTMDVMIKTAISGDSTVRLLESFDWRVSKFSPDVVFLMIGMNDCSADRNISLQQFKNNLDELAEKIKSLGALCVMQTTCPILPNTAPERYPYFESYMQAVRDAAAKHDLPLIDHTAYWQKNIDKLYLWMSNQFHPNEYGHRAFAKLIYDELEIFDPKSNSCRFFIP